MKQLTLENKKLPYSVEEALNRLRVNFGFIGPEYKKILITSSTMGEGKSFIAFQLWRMLAESGKKVVLVDADVRKSILRTRHRIMGEDGGYQGLAFYLAGQASIEDVVYETNIPNGYMVPVSYTVSNPSLLLQGERFPHLLDVLAQQFDYVLVDTPPVTAVADSNLIASHCDGAIFVVRGGATSRRVIANSLKQLEIAGCKLLGTVLNRVEAKDSPYYYRYNKGYYNNYYYKSYGSDSKPLPEEQTQTVQASANEK